MALPTEALSVLFVKAHQKRNHTDAEVVFYALVLRLAGFGFTGVVMSNQRNGNPFVLILFVAIWAWFVSASHSLGTTTREQVVGWLYQDAQLVRSMECRYTVRVLKTTAADAELISKLAEARGDPSLRGRYIFSDEDARVRSYAGHWWRKGEKERHESFKLDQGELGTAASVPFYIEAFDGALVRALGTGGGTIHNPATAGYGNMPPQTNLWVNFGSGRAPRL